MPGGKKKARRGEIRWLRDRNILYLQWKDRRVVNMMSTVHTANDKVTAKRREKRGNSWTEISVAKPLLIHDYNAGMLGVDKSDQMIGYYNVLMRSVRWWKTLFFHCIDIACVNSFILFEAHRKLHPEIAELSRNAGYDHLAFREELIHQLLSLDDARPARSAPPPPPPSARRMLHKPEKVDRRNNCKLCYEKTKTELKTNVFCSTCKVHLCFTTARNCFAEWHKHQAS